MNEKTVKIEHDFYFKATGIGSVPSLGVPESCAHILEHIPEVPYWPQLVKRSHLEDMVIQFSEGLPLLKIREENRSLVVSSDDPESALVSFYDRFLADDVPYFAISREYAPGFYELVDTVCHNPEKYGSFIKGQTVGPVTFAAGITDEQEKSILHNPDLLDAAVKGLAIKALWQVNELKKTGKRTILFLDEPYLSGFGSAFTPIQRHEVVGLLKEVIDYIRDRSEALIGVHCCGNTDWPMIIETGPDIINFDAYSYMDTFLLYPEELSRFLSEGGVVAWGIVPTADFTGEETAEGLLTRLEEGLKRLEEWGLDAEQIAKCSLLTPACGMGTMDVALAERVLVLLSELSKKLSPARS
jgi:methionine synthase II (cobalamin-independent)